MIMHTIDFEECLKDSPTYRHQLRQAAAQIDLLEDRLEQMSRTCNAVVNTGKTFVQDFQKFLKCIFDVRELFASDAFVCRTFDQFGHYLREIQSLFSNLLEHTTHSVLRTLTRMLKEDIRKVKDQGKLFERLSADYDIALQRNADVSKSKPHVCEDAAKILLATRSCFGHTSIDYTYHINVLFDQHKIDLVELFLTYINLHKAFFHQGYELLAIDSENEFNGINSQITRVRQESAEKHKLLENVHRTNQKRYNLDDYHNDAAPTDPSVSMSNETRETMAKNASQLSLSTIIPAIATNGIEATKEGYLFKRSHNKFKTWNRRWFSIRNGQLLYTKRSSAISAHDASPSSSTCSVMVPDLRLCTIRPSPDYDRRSVFEIISPNSSHLLQANSAIECEQWIHSLQLAISNSFKSSDDAVLSGSSNSSDDRSNTLLTAKTELKRKIINEKIEYVRALAGNEKCCDCDADEPEWASINLGILLCLNCGGAHRGLGVSLSKVRSLHMDTWDLETLLVMAELGNTAVNSVYEGQMPAGMTKPTAEADAITRRSFIEAKYVRKAFLRPFVSAQPIRTSTRAIKRWTVMKNNTSLTHPTPDNEDEPPQQVKTNHRHTLFKRSPHASDNDPLTNSSSPVLDVNLSLYEGARHHNLPIMLHALALGADKNFLNENDHGRTPLIQAIFSRSVAAAEFLLTNNAKVSLSDRDGQTPLHFATRLASKGRGPIILLLKRGADPLLKDHHGVNACSLSMEMGDPDVITWYRLIALHEQMKVEDADAEKSYISILDDPVYMKEIARTPSFS